MSGINLVTTILKVRAPGMSYMRMPVFCWTSLASNLLIVAAFPILTATLAMLTLDRYLGFHFFTNDLGGNPMMFVNLIWAWGHPEVYILILPAFGIFSKSSPPSRASRCSVIARWSPRPWRSASSSFLVWLHHFFTMGAGADVNAVVRRRDHDHHDSDRREGLQLALHHVSRPGTLHDADAMVGRLHGDLRHQRHDRRADGGTASGLRAAQLACSSSRIFIT